MFRPSFGTGSALLVVALFVAFMSVIGIGGLTLAGTKAFVLTFLVLSALSFLSGFYFQWRSRKQG